MRILIDSREQRPLDFESDHPIIQGTARAPLAVGDYGAEFSDGSICPIYFERKSLSDLFGTLTSGHVRFREELLRARRLKRVLILAIEGTIADILNGDGYSEVSGFTIFKKLMTLWLKYDLVPMFFTSREEMAFAIQEFYLAFGRNYKLKAKNDSIDASSSMP